MTRQLRIARLLLGVSLIFAFATARAAAQTSGTPPGQRPSPPSRPPQPQTDQMTNIPYFSLRDGMNSTLTLNNIGPKPTTVTVTIFNTEGRAHVLDPIILDLHSFKEINLVDVVPGQEFDSGNIEVAYHGIMMGVTCQVSVVSADKRVSFESREQDMMDFESSSMNGIVWLPQEEAKGYLAVTNTAKNRVTVELTVGSKKKLLSLFSRETNLIKLNEELDGDPPVAALVKLRHTGLPGDVITSGFVMNLDDGYSSSFPMIDPSSIKSSHLSGIHFRFGKPDPGEGFPANTQFRSPLLLANVGAEPVTAHISVDYTVQETLKMSRWETKDAKDSKDDKATEDKFETKPVKTITIAPGDVQRIELSEEMAKLGMAQPAEEAGVDIAYDAAPGAVIGQLTSVDQTGDYSFEVPIIDPAELGQAIESAYPWTIEGGMNTVLHLKNTTGDTVHADLLFDFPDGKNYNPDPLVLQPYQSVAFDIQKLKESGKLDAQGRAFPADARHGLLFWHQDLPYSMIGRAEGTNLKEGIAKSFSCTTGCCDFYWAFYYLNPYPMYGEPGGSGPFTPGKSWGDCAGNSGNYNPYGIQPSGGWSSNNTAVATVNSTGYTTCGTPGSCTVTALYRDKVYDWNANYTRCVYTIQDFPAPAPVLVNTPDHVRVLNDLNIFPVCPAGTGPAIKVRQISVNLVDINSVLVQQNYSTVEHYSNPTSPISSCPAPWNVPPQASGCALTTTGYCPTCTGAWTDTLAVANNFCTSGIPQSSGCGFSETSAWYMCSNGLANAVWLSARTTLSNNITVNANSGQYTPGTILH
jgi:hypothetical protein